MIGVMKSSVSAIKNSPPVLNLRELKYESKFQHNRDLNLFKGIFKDFESANIEAKKYPIAGYNNQDPALMYKDMCKKIFPEDYPTLFWLSRFIQSKQVKSIIDFGGHIGIKRYAFDTYLPELNQMKWNVFDLPKVIEEAREFNQNYDPENKLNMGFVDHTEGLSTDLFLALGSFQYIPKEVNDILLALNELPPYLLVRVPLTKKETFVTLNHIGTTICPYIIRNEAIFEQEILDSGYEIVDKWVSPNKKCEIPFYEDYSVHGYTGYVFKLKSASL